MGKYVGVGTREGGEGLESLFPILNFIMEGVSAKRLPPYTWSSSSQDMKSDDCQTLHIKFIFYFSPGASVSPASSERDAQEAG